MGIAYTVSQIGMSVLKVTREILKKLEVSPDPVIVTNDPLKTQRRVGMHPTTSTNADIVFNQNYAINSHILGDATIVNQLASIFILHNLIAIQPKKVGPSHTALYVMVSRKTVLDISAQLLLPNYLFLQSDHYQLMILTITLLFVIVPCHLQM